jgi:Calcineurin-like phosphoesterase
MRTEPFPPTDVLGQAKKSVEGFWSSFSSTPIPDIKPSDLAANIDEAVEEDSREFWFDYFADSGDSVLATYNIAYLITDDLFLYAGANWNAVPPGLKIKRISQTDIPELEGCKVTTERESDDDLRLPRGAFLFVGGDTTYHVADYASLATRFQEPFNKAIEQRGDVESRNNERRPIFGIPGNHDYYDELDGFNRQFRKPIRDEDYFLDLHGRNMFPQLRIHGFERIQEASYLALQLPFGWWFLGLDCEIHRLDVRQQEFFKFLDKAAADSDHEHFRKLIVATPEPTTVEGRYSDRNDKTSQAFADIELNRPFLYRQPWVDKKAPSPLEDDKPLKLRDFDCRLDISGDTHHYARYWGKYQDGRHDNYASVVSGGGGASMSPTQVDLGQVDAVVKYPPPRKSSELVNKRLFRFFSVWNGGNVHIAGGLIAAIFFVFFVLDSSHGIFLRHLLSLIPVLGAQVGVVNYTAPFSGAGPVGYMVLACVQIAALGLYSLFLFNRLTKTYDLAFNFATNTSTPEHLKTQFEELLDNIKGSRAADRAVLVWGPILIISALSFVLFLILVWVQYPFIMLLGNGGATRHLFQWAILTLLVDAAAGFLSWWLKHKVDVWGDESVKLNTPEQLQAGLTTLLGRLKQVIVAKWLDYVPIWGIFALGVVWLGISLTEIHFNWEALSEFVFASTFFVGVLFLISIAVVSIFYSSWLFKQSYRIEVTRRSYGPVIGLNILWIIAAGTMIWAFAPLRLRPALIDSLFLLALIITVFGCIGLAVGVGAGRRPILGKIGFFLLGLWHGLVQLIIPTLTVFVAGLAGVVTASAGILLMTIFSGIFVKLAKAVESENGNPTKRSLPRFVLLFIWLALGVGFFVLPFITNTYLLSYLWWFRAIEPTSIWLKLLFLVIVGLLGAVFTCFWLGWYFAISVLFNGHGNEAGSTALIDDHKQFIRFRLTEHTLTGFVIGIDELNESVRSIKPRLVDVFRLELPQKH